MFYKESRKVHYFICTKFLTKRIGNFGHFGNSDIDIVTNNNIK